MNGHLYGEDLIKKGKMGNFQFTTQLDGKSSSYIISKKNLWK